MKKNKVLEIEEDLNKILELKGLFQSKGGEQLILLLRNNCAEAIGGLLNEVNGTPNLDRLVSLVHKYSANISLLSAMQDISLETEIRNQLDQAIQEMKNEEMS